MILHVKPAPCLRGACSLPASKSYTIRAFLIASRGGNSTILLPSDCDDAKVALRVSRQLGASIKHTRKGVVIKACARKPVGSHINVGESGTVLRFVLPLLPFHFQNARIEGKGTLRGRPNAQLTRALRCQGVKIKGKGRQESVPIVLRGGKLRGGLISVDGSVSSQFISALLIACPQLAEDSRLVLRGRKLVSLDYITMTEQILKRAGVRIERLNSRRYKISGKQKFRGLKNFTVPSDLGLAAFLLAGAALVKSKVTLKGSLCPDLLQADGQILPFLKKMGVRLKTTKSSIGITGPFALKGGTFSLKDCPDLVPVMAVLALFARGTTRLTNIAHARVKESNRITDLRKELQKVGAKIEERPNAMIIHPGQKLKANVLLDPHNDHRLAMAFSVLGLKVGVRIKDIECVKKSYPGFVRDLCSLGAKAKRG